MADVTGTAPNRTTPREVEIVRRENSVSIWVHSPNSDNGWQAWVPLPDLQAALAEEEITN
jgi:hypothetical protein